MEFRALGFAVTHQNTPGLEFRVYLFSTRHLLLFTFSSVPGLSKLSFSLL